MSFKITISNVSDKDLGPLIARLRLPRGATQDIKHASNGAVEPVRRTKQKGGRTTKDSVLTMTGKQPKKGTQIAKALTMFEKLEVHTGIGSITVEIFRHKLKRSKLPWQLQQRCINEKFLTYVE